MKVFISYAREDQEQAERIFRFISTIPEAQPWMDIHDILPGADWEYEITKALDESDIVLLLLSQNSVNKTGYIQREVRKALELYERHPPGDIYLIPVRLDYCTPRHLMLKKLNWVDLFSDWDYGLEKISTVIKRSLPADVETVTNNYQESRETLRNFQNEMNEKAKEVLEVLPNDLVENLGSYSEWLGTHDWMLPPVDYNSTRKSIPNWTKQAKGEWVKLLQEHNMIETGDPDTALFSDLGLHLLTIVPWTYKYE